MVMHPVDELLRAGEGEGVEFKTSLSDTRKIIETAAALATRGGGTILIGVRDDRSVVGVNLGAGEVERLVQQVLASTDPRLYLHVERLVHEEKPLLRIDVPAGDGPHLAFGRAFHRVGPATVAMTRDEYERRLLDRLRESSGFERRRVDGGDVGQLDDTAARDWLEHARGRLKDPPSGESARAVGERLHLVQGAAVTVAGWLLLAREPDGLLPQATIRALAERGAGHDALVIGGPVCRQIDEAFAFVSRNLRRQGRVVKTRRTEQPELPLDAVREVIANAVAHRDYRSTAAIQLRLSDDGLELWNAGELPPPLTPALLRERHPSVPPNPLLARALFLAGYIEEWGTGTLKVIEALKREGHPEPVFESQPGKGVRVFLPFKGAGAAVLSERERAGLKGVGAGRLLSSADYARRAEVSLRTAASDLARLEARGLVVRSGVGRATRWRRV